MILKNPLIELHASSKKVSIRNRGELALVLTPPKNTPGQTRKYYAFFDFILSYFTRNFFTPLYRAFQPRVGNKVTMLNLNTQVQVK